MKLSGPPFVDSFDALLRRVHLAVRTYMTIAKTRTMRDKKKLNFNKNIDKKECEFMLGNNLINETHI